MSVKKALFILFIIAIFSAATVYYLIPKKKKIEYTTDIVRKGKITQTVSETGTIKAVKELDLSFSGGGKLSKLLVKVGDAVSASQAVAELDKRDLEIKMSEAQANLDVAEQSLAKLLAGTVSEEIAIAEASVNQASKAYDSSKNDLSKISKSVNEAVRQAGKTVNDLTDNSAATVTTQEQAVASAEDNLSNIKSTSQRSIDDNLANVFANVENKIILVNTALDNINRILTDEDGKDLISKKNSSFLAQTNSYYSSARTGLSNIQASLISVKKSQDKNEASKLLSDTDSVLSLTSFALLNCYNALENSITDLKFTQSKIDSFKSTVTGQQSIISGGITAVEAAIQSLGNAILTYDTKVSAAMNSVKEAKTSLANFLLNAQNALNTARTEGEKQIASAQARIDSAAESVNVAKAQLSRLKAPVNAYDRSLAEAKIRQANAAIAAIKKQIDDCVLLSPYSGIVTQKRFEIGEQVAPSVPIITISGNANFEVEVLISEADIAKVHTGNKVEITFDAFGDEMKFSGSLNSIEPAQTEVQGVIYYKANIVFDPKGQAIKAGMTANVTIVSAEKDKALIVSSRAIIQKADSSKVIRILKDNAVTEYAVETGLKGDGGEVEVLSGSSEGDVAVLSIKESK